MSGNEDIVDTLTEQLYNLELESQEIKRKQYHIEREIRNLKKKINNKKTKATQRKGANQKKAEEVVLDRNKVPLSIGDKVYLYTSGVHNSRRGVVTAIEKPPKFCTILDTDGIQQTRKANNLVIE